MRVSLLLSVCLVVPVALAGCTDESPNGPQTVQVTGTVTLDGEPVEGAHVTFKPETAGPVAFAVTDKRGRYRLRNSLSDDGAVPGKYAIFVVKEVTEGGMEFESETALEAYVKEHGNRPPAAKTVNELPEIYSDRKRPALTAEINMAKDNHFDLELASEQVDPGKK